MAKIVGGMPPPFIGTRDNLTIYLMNGEYIVRTKSSLTGKRVKRDPAFAKTMKYAGWLKQASRIASCVYRQIPADERIYKQYRQLTGKAMLLLKEGFAVDDVITMLGAVYLHQSMQNAADSPIDECHEYTNEYTGEYSNGNGSGNSSELTSKYSGEYSGEYTGKHSTRNESGNSSELTSECSSNYIGKHSNGNESGNSSELTNEYSGEYSSEHSGKNNSECVKYSGKQTDLNVSKCGCRIAVRCNSKSCRECSSAAGRCNDKRANAKGCEYKYAHEYMLSYYCFGDRPQRAVQVGITGISYLKYVDAVHQGFHRYSKAKHALQSSIERELQRTTASDPSLQP